MNIYLHARQYADCPSHSRYYSCSYYCYYYFSFAGAHVQVSHCPGATPLGRAQWLICSTHRPSARAGIEKTYSPVEQGRASVRRNMVNVCEEMAITSIIFDDCAVTIHKNNRNIKIMHTMPEILLSSSTLSRKSSLSIRPVNPVKPYLHVAKQKQHMNKIQGIG